MIMSTNKMVLPVLLVAFFIRVYATNELAIDHDEYDVYRRVLGSSKKINRRNIKQIKEEYGRNIFPGSAIAPSVVRVQP